MRIPVVSFTRYDVDENALQLTLDAVRSFAEDPRSIEIDILSSSSSLILEAAKAKWILSVENIRQNPRQVSLRSYTPKIAPLESVDDRCLDLLRCNAFDIMRIFDGLNCLGLFSTLRGYAADILSDHAVISRGSMILLQEKVYDKLQHLLSPYRISSEDAVFRLIGMDKIQQIERSAIAAIQDLI